MADNEPIVVIGGGIGGLCTAIWLALKGELVILFEKNQAIGGKMREFHQDGFRWDMGPGFITMRNLYEEIFKAAGKRLGDHLQLLPVDPISQYFFQDGTRLDIRRDLSRTLENIASIGKLHVEEYLSFLAFSSRQYRLVESIFALGPSTIPGFIRRIGLANFFKADLFEILIQQLKNTPPRNT
jgi:phytoene dehydrogenase-like protein